MNSRIAQLALAAALLVVSAAVVAEAGSARDLLKRFAAGPTPPTELDSIGEELVKMQAVDEILAAAVGLSPEGDRGIRLARILARIDTKESVNALRKMLYTSRYFLTDIPDWRSFLLRLDAASRQPQLDEYVASTLPTVLKERAKEDGNIRGNDERQRRILARALNRIIEDSDLHKKINGSQLDLGDEATELLERHKRYQQPMPGSSLAPIEIERLNRRILDAAYRGVLEKLDALPINRYNPALVSASFASLGHSTRSEAGELLFTVQPLELRARLDHIASISKMKSDDADIALAEYLRDKEGTVSLHARDALIERFGKDSASANSAMRMAVANLRGRSAESVRDHVVKNTLLVCISIPAEQLAAALIATALGSDHERVVLCALDVLETKPELVRNAEILSALLGAAQESDEPTRATRMLKMILKLRVRDGMDIAVYYLEHPKIEVSSLAANVMRQLSGKNLGRNPKKWLAALKSNPGLLDREPDNEPLDNAMDEQDSGQGASVEAQESSYDTVTTAVGLASLGAIAIIFLRWQRQ